jgi:hypothetical protein
MTESLPFDRRDEFNAFLGSQGLDELHVTAAHKVLWLRHVIDAEPTPSFSVLRTYAKGLRAYGPQDAESRAEDHAIVNAYVLHLRHSDRLKPPGHPAAAMPDHVLEEIIDALQPSRRVPIATPMRLRLRALLLLTRRSGLDAKPCTRVMHHQFRPSSSGLILQHRMKRRLIEIPIIRQSNAKLCAVTALEEWTTFQPCRQPGYVFPERDTAGHVWYDRPMSLTAPGTTLRALLLRLGYGEHTYTFKSLRRAYLREVRDKHGFAAAYYVSGYSSLQNLRINLRGEPDWNAARSLL